MQLQKENEIIDTAINFAEIPFDIKKDDLSRYGDANLECYEKLLLNAEYEFDFKNGKINSEILGEIQQEKLKRKPITKESTTEQPSSVQRFASLFPLLAYIWFASNVISVFHFDYKLCTQKTNSFTACAITNIAEIHPNFFQRITAEMAIDLESIHTHKKNNQGENK